MSKQTKIAHLLWSTARTFQKSHHGNKTVVIDKIFRIHFRNQIITIHLLANLQV